VGQLLLPRFLLVGSLPLLAAGDGGMHCHTHTSLRLLPIWYNTISIEAMRELGTGRDRGSSRAFDVV
jgi:hypothetical protein